MNVDKLKGVIPDGVITQIDSIKDKFEINTALRLAHFLAQCGHESGNFKLTQENLNYSGKGLLATFSKYFNAETAILYERKPEKIANVVYANRMGNGDKASGDGYKFRGRGYIQLTGHDNYAAFGKAIGEDILASPDLIATKYPLASAAWFWNKNKINAIADGGATSEVVAKVTRKVNGGVIGLDDRIKHFYQFHNLLIGSI
jgi:putative chitinase